MSDKYMNWFWYAFTYLVIVLGILSTILLIELICGCGKKIINVTSFTGSFADIVIALANIAIAYAALKGIHSWLNPKKMDLKSKSRVDLYKIERALAKVFLGPESRELHKDVVNKHVYELEASLIVLNTIDEEKYSKEVLDNAFSSLSNILSMFNERYVTNEHIEQAFGASISRGSTEMLNNDFNNFAGQKFNLKVELDSVKSIFN